MLLYNRDELRNILTELLTTFIVDLNTIEIRDKYKLQSKYILIEAYINEYQQRFGIDNWLSNIYKEHITPLNDLLYEFRHKLPNIINN